MKLINTNDILSFVPEGDETEAEQAFLARIKQYTIKKNGASILIYGENDRLMLHINPFDNTQSICTADSYTLASDFSAKRFVIGEARKQLDMAKAEEVKAIHFSRDLSFPIEKSVNDDTQNYKIVDLAGLLNQFSSDSDKDRLYTQLAELFNRCADFTPGKQDEYLSGGKKEDKFCRFNLMNTTDQTVRTEQVFLLDDKNKLVGTISATIINSNENALDIYFYDEVVDYFTLLSSEEKLQFDVALRQLKTEENATFKATLEKDIAALIDPKRSILMAQLFSATRLSLRKLIINLDEKIESGAVHAFIRAALGRVEAYRELGCGKANTENFVIHGMPTSQLNMLDALVKTWAAEQLKLLQPKVSSLFLLSPKTDRKTSIASAPLDPSKSFKR
jgi:hypothetical protein